MEMMTNELIPDDINDSLEQIVSRYNPSFDWKTQTPSRQDILQAVINAVIAYFSTSDVTERQEILNDVMGLVKLYFTLPAYEMLIAISGVFIIAVALKKSKK